MKNLDLGGVGGSGRFEEGTEIAARYIREEAGTQ